MKILLLVVAVGTILGASDYYDRCTDIKKISWMDKGKQSVKAKLKDGSSAKFKKVFFHNGKQKVPVTCGEVNAKNSYGAYGGYTLFISAGSPKNTFMQSDIKDFHNLWNTLCVN